MPQRYTWNKAEKLKSRKRIDQVFKQGRTFSAFPFKVFYVVTPTATPPAGSTPPQAAGSPLPSEPLPQAVPPARPTDSTSSHSAGSPLESDTRPEPRSRSRASTSRPAPIQAGFGAGSRHFKKAVDRNRIKRLCREAYRLQKQPLVDLLASRGLTLAVFFVYTGKDLPDYQSVTGKIGVILQKLIKEMA